MSVEQTNINKEYIRTVGSLNAAKHFINTYRDAKCKWTKGIID